MPARNDLQFLLLQARLEGDPMRSEEQQSFARQLTIADEQVHGLDILTTPPDDSMLQDVHAVLVGGAGDFGVVHPNDAITHLMGFLARHRIQRLPGVRLVLRVPGLGQGDLVEQSLRTMDTPRWEQQKCPAHPPHPVIHSSATCRIASTRRSAIRIGPIDFPTEPSTLSRAVLVHTMRSTSREPGPGRPSSTPN